MAAGFIESDSWEVACEVGLNISIGLIDLNLTIGWRRNKIACEQIEVSTNWGGEYMLVFVSIFIAFQTQFRLHLPKYKEHYTWGKVTTSVEDIFSGNRY